MFFHYPVGLVRTASNSIILKSVFVENTVLLSFCPFYPGDLYELNFTDEVLNFELKVGGVLGFFVEERFGKSKIFAG